MRSSTLGLSDAGLDANCACVFTCAHTCLFTRVFVCLSVGLTVCSAFCLCIALTHSLTHLPTHSFAHSLIHVTFTSSECVIVCLLAGSRAFSLAIVIAHRSPVAIYSWFGPTLGWTTISCAWWLRRPSAFGSSRRSFCARLLCEHSVLSRSGGRPLSCSPALAFGCSLHLGALAPGAQFYFLFFLVLDDVWPHQRLSIARLLSSQIYFTLWFSTSLALLASVPLDYSGARHHRS